MNEKRKERQKGGEQMAAEPKEKSAEEQLKEIIEQANPMQLEYIIYLLNEEIAKREA